MKPTSTTTTPDGRTFASTPRTDGPAAAEFPVPGELGALLTESGYRARVVVERVDGGALVAADAAFIGDAMAAAAEHGTHAPQVRERAASGHFARARARVAERTARKHSDAAE
ncbi:MAG: hypothetical protein JWM10_2567 [Myxococcaceae bacterium]|nr:hypothetical protein [Myxococcaceae bacterium]